MKYDEVEKQLIFNFPDFFIDKISEGLPYCVAGGFALFLLELYKKKDILRMKEGICFIEKLHHSKDSKTRELATIGYLEGIQNVWGNNDVNPEEIYKYLGKESKKWWVRLNKYWNGDIHALSDD